jgi:hypothetical protein
MWSLEGTVKHIALVGVLLFSSLSFADAGTPEVVDAGIVASLEASVVGSEVVDAGVAVADAGTKLVDGDTVDFSGIAKKALEAGHDKNWSILFGFASIVVALTWLARRFGGLYVPFLKTDRGGALIVLLFGVSGGLLNALAVDSTVTVDSIVAGMGVGFQSAGGFSVLKKLTFPSDVPAAPTPAPTPAPETPKKD